MVTVDGKALPTRHRIEIKVLEEQKNVIVPGAELARQGISELVRAARARRSPTAGETGEEALALGVAF